MVEPGFFDGLDVTLLSPPASAKNREGVTGALDSIAQALVNKAIPLRAERALHLDSVSFGPVPNFDVPALVWLILCHWCLHLPVVE